MERTYKGYKIYPQYDTNLPSDHILMMLFDEAFYWVPILISMNLSKYEIESLIESLETLKQLNPPQFKSNKEDLLVKLKSYLTTD